MKKNKGNSFEWSKSWVWFVILSLAVFVFYEQAKKKKEKEISLLTNQLHQLHYDHEVLLTMKEKTDAKINSQNDPKWVELVLMKELGVVPNGYMKVYFKRDMD